MQSFFIALGAVVASALPWMMSNWMGVANTAPEGEIPVVRMGIFMGIFNFFIVIPQLLAAAAFAVFFVERNV